MSQTIQRYRLQRNRDWQQPPYRWFWWVQMVNRLTTRFITPATGTALGGTAVTITGAGFRSGATVTVGGASATSVVFEGSGWLTAVTPAGLAGARDVVVTNPDTKTATLPGGFLYT